MKKINPKTVTGVLLFSALVGSSMIAARHRKREKEVATFFTKLSQRLDPSKLGLDNEPALDPNYLNSVRAKTSRRIVVLKKSTLERLAKSLKSAWKPWYKGGNDDQKVHEVLESLKDKVQISQLAKAYQELNYGNLKEVFRSELNASEIDKALRIIRKKSPYSST